MNLTAIRRNSAKFFFLLVLLAVGGGVSARAQNVYTTAEGAQIEVSVRPEKGTILLGEPVYLIFQIRARSDLGFRFEFGPENLDERGRPYTYRIAAVRKDGKKVPLPPIIFPHIDGFFGCGPAGQIHVQPGNDYQQKLFLPTWVSFEEPGEYRITVRRFLPLNRTQDQTDSPIPPLDVTQDRIPSSKEVEAETTITVIPSDEFKMGEVIQEIGERMFDPDTTVSNDAIRAMGYIRDTRTIPFFTRVLQATGNIDPNRIVDNLFGILKAMKVVKALATWPDDEALESLRQFSTSPNWELRSEVAVGLRNGKHPGAHALLATMWKDSSWSVRLQVAQGLNGGTSEAYRKILETLTTDENEEVRKAAKRALEPASPQKPRMS